ncbi:hypothetical protein HDU96_003807, partial [Phlyctochytrium bullatum]
RSPLDCPSAVQPPSPQLLTQPLSCADPIVSRSFNRGTRANPKPKPAVIRGINGRELGFALGLAEECEARNISPRAVGESYRVVKELRTYNAPSFTTLDTPGLFGKFYSLVDQAQDWIEPIHPLRQLDSITVADQDDIRDEFGNDTEALRAALNSDCIALKGLRDDARNLHFHVCKFALTYVPDDASERSSKSVAELKRADTPNAISHYHLKAAGLLVLPFLDLEIQFLLADLDYNRSSSSWFRSLSRSRKSLLLSLAKPPSYTSRPRGSTFISFRSAVRPQDRPIFVDPRTVSPPPPPRDRLDRTD